MSKRRPYSHPAALTAGERGPSKGIRKPAARLAARIKGYNDVPVHQRGGFRIPGSLKKIH